MLELLNDRSSEKSIITILSLVERLIFIQTMLLDNYQFRNLNLFELTLKFKKDGNTEKLESHIRIMTEKLLKHAHKEISLKFKDSDFYNWSGIKYLLYEYEYSL